MKATHDTIGSGPHTNDYSTEAFGTDHATEVAIQQVNDLHDGETAWRISRFPEANCCGATGCRHGDHLAQVRIQGYGERVLCPFHVLDLLDREVPHWCDMPANHIPRAVGSRRLTLGAYKVAFAILAKLKISEGKKA